MSVIAIDDKEHINEDTRELETESQKYSQADFVYRSLRDYKELLRIKNEENDRRAVGNVSENESGRENLEANGK